MPAPKQSLRGQPAVALNTGAGSKTEIKLPLDEAATVLYLQVEGTYDVAGAAAVVHEDSHSRLFSNITVKRTGHQFYDMDAFTARVIADHEFMGGSADLAFDTTVGNGRVFRSMIALPFYMPHIRNPFVAAADPRGFNEFKVQLTARAIADVLGGNASNFVATVTPILQVIADSPGLDGRAAVRRQEEIKTAAGTTSRTVDLKADGVIDRVLIIARTAAGARSDDLITNAELVVGGQERRLEDVNGYQMSAIAARSQGEALPIGVHMYETDPDDFLDPNNLISAPANSSTQLRLTTANADDDVIVVAHYMLRTKVAA